LRSLLFVPGDSERKLARGRASGADALILDLEDSVVPAAKAAARAAAAAQLAALPGPREPAMFVRINPLDSGLAEADLDAVMAARPDGIVLPKCRSGADAARALALMARSGGQTGGTKLLVIATETADSLFNLGTYRQAGPGLWGLSWGMEDLSAELGAIATRRDDGAITDPYRIARSLTLIAARAAGAEPVDGVWTALGDLAGLAVEARAAARDGFTAKVAIHPEQVEAINQAFTPSEAEVAAARAIVAAFAAAPGRGALRVAGQMVDQPHLKRAERLLARAGRPSWRQA
jgi:citrate lyase subunit beta/citryl-CoA lyase